MSNLQLRVVSALVLAVVVLGLTWIGAAPFRMLAAIIGALVFHEWSTVSGMRRDPVTFWLSWAAAAVVLGLLAVGVPAAYLLLTAAGAVVVSAMAALVRGQGISPATGVGYAVLPAIALASLRGDTLSGLLAVVFLFAVVWATDILAYFVGRAIGGPKLAPSISPGKTWSGAIGGAVAGVVAGILAAQIAGEPSLVLLGGLALLLSVVSQAGDLFESAFKRRHGAKDSSNLIPGHGGVMDRVDGLVAAALALYLAGWLLSGPDNPSAGLFPL